MAAAVASAINWGDGLRRRRVYRHHRNNAEQGFLTTTALSLPLPRSDSSRNRTLTLLATSFGTNDDRPTPLAGQPGVQQRRGLLGALLINRNATQPAGNRSCKLMDQGDYCANAIRLQGTVASVAACWAAASEHAGCGDEIVSNAPTISVSRSDSEPTVGMQCFCIPKSQACEKPQPSSVGNIVYKCHHLRGVLETTQPAVVNLTAGGWTVRPGTLGEHLHLGHAAPAADIVWSAGAPAPMLPALWLRGIFPTPADPLTRQSLAVDMQVCS